MEFEAYLTFLQKLGDCFAQLTAVEQEKLQAVKDGSLARLNDCIRQEQASALTLRGMEQQRTQWLTRLGLADGKLRSLPAQCPPDLAPRTRQVVERVLEQYQVLESAREASRSLLECQLHRIEGAMARQGIGPEADDPAPPAAPGRTLTDFRA